ncbi:MAG: TIM barrel protein [Methanosarcinales archaeon]|nr:TIM barrel protein [Methanosarcinales archaeon]
MGTMDDLFFGTAGVPASSAKRDSSSGIKRIKELGLGCMELEFVRGVKMGTDTASKVKAVATEMGVALSVHAPYYINLNSKEPDKVDASMERIFQSAYIGGLCGVRSVVFHPAFYQKVVPQQVYSTVCSRLESIIEKMRSHGIEVVLRPETTGKPTQFGDLDETIRLSSEVDGVLPCIDFSHLHAREGECNTYEEFRDVLQKIEDNLGREGLNNMHIHISGIEYGDKGEQNHLILQESDFRYVELMHAFRDYRIKGLVICESPNLEVDAMLLKDAYCAL